MRRLVHASVVLAALAAGCETGDVKADLEKLRAANAALAGQLEKLRAEKVQLRREITAKAARASAENQKAIGELRGELRAMREELAGTDRHEPAPLLIDPELEERLLHKAEELHEGVWGLPPSGCVRILGEIIERYPNTRAALKAQNALSEWEALGVEVTDENAREIDERIRSLLKARATIWRGIQNALRAAEGGEAEEAVSALRGIAERRQDEPGRRAREILENWGVAGLDPAEIDFAELGPRVKREAAAQREIEKAFRSLHKGRPEAAVKAFRKVIRKYPDLRQTERAREALEDAEAELRERRAERERERRRDRRREGELRGERGRDEPRAEEERPRERDEKKDGAPIF